MSKWIPINCTHNHKYTHYIIFYTLSNSYMLVIATNACIHAVSRPASQPANTTGRVHRQQNQIFHALCKYVLENYKSSPVGCIADAQRPMSRVCAESVCVRARVCSCSCAAGGERYRQNYYKHTHPPVLLLISWSHNVTRCVGTLLLLYSTSLIVTCQAVICEEMLIMKQ